MKKKRSKLQWVACLLLAAVMMMAGMPTVSVRAEEIADLDLINDEPNEVGRQVGTGGPGNSGEIGTNPTVLFGQNSISANFSTNGTMKGASVISVANQIASGTLSTNNLPIEYVVRNGTAIALNNRSLAALSMANTKPSVLIDTTGNAINEAKVTARLSEMGGMPSESISIRNTGYTVNIVK